MKQGPRGSRPRCLPALAGGPRGPDLPGAAPGYEMLRQAMSEHEQRFELLADLGAMIAGEVELDDLLATFAARVAHALGADRATLWLIDAATGEIRSRVATLPELPELRLPPGRGVVGHVARTGELMNNRDVGADPRWDEAIAQRTGYRVTSMLTAPIVRRGQIRGVLQVLNKLGGAFTERDEGFIRVLAEQIGRTLDYTTLRGDDASRGLALRGRFNHVIGRSPAMAAVYEMILRAAQTDATVLLRGETGTGKGLLARAIHANSARRPRALDGSADARGAVGDPPFVHVDCTTLPAALVESELFGHERGAYTGADSRVIGKVEAADRGTLFLDEIGELPLPLQGKLLRVLQSQEFRRIGDDQDRRVDVRIVTATNRDLDQLVARGSFRQDLYYRINVFPMHLPPLRDRPEDIALLVHHFISKYRGRLGKPIDGITPGALRRFAAYDFPGNIRELENKVHQAMVVAEGPLIGEADVALPAGRIAGGRPDITRPFRELKQEAIDAFEKAYLIELLREHRGNLARAARAAGMDRKNLWMLVARHGLDRDQFRKP